MTIKMHNILVEQITVQGEDRNKVSLWLHVFFYNHYAFK